uniref:Uncharacterized protein n=1 Tax=Kalanchoe fedtschenkoi TaxID=63787 RepID=A0A7N0UTP9_KALFE
MRQPALYHYLDDEDHSLETNCKSQTLSQPLVPLLPRTMSDCIIGLCGQSISRREDSDSNRSVSYWGNIP